jgi:hypothetical protein
MPKSLSTGNRGKEAAFTQPSGNFTKWRLGRKVPINVYEGDRPICQCHTVLDARRIVESVNAWRQFENPRRAPKPRTQKKKAV